MSEYLTNGQNKNFFRTLGALTAALLCSGSSCMPLGYHESPVIGPGSTKWVRTGYTLKTTREERLQFNKEVEAKVERFIDSHPNLTDLERDALKKFQVAEGMTKAQITLLLGNPLEVLTSPEGLPGNAKDQWIRLPSIDEAWLYRINSSRFNNAVAVIYYDEDRVISIMEYGDYYLLP